MPNGATRVKSRFGQERDRMDATGARAGAFRGFTIGHERENVDYDDAAVNLGTMISNATLTTHSEALTIT